MDLNRQKQPGRGLFLSRWSFKARTELPPDDGKYATNWELSVMRAVSVLHYPADLGVNDNQFQVAGFGDTVPLMSNDTEEGRAYNRRVGIVILADANL